MLEVVDLHIYNGREVLVENFSFSLKKGQHKVITGDSGTGKTTLLYALLGFFPVKQGRICWHEEATGRCVDDPLLIRQQTAWLPQDFTMPVDKPRELVDLLAGFSDNKHYFDADMLAYYLDQLGLSPVILDQHTHTLSGGERQRILFAIALAMNKPLILMDEPTSALDRKSIDKLFRVIDSIKDRIALLSVSHHPDWVRVCDQEMIIDKK